jgi:hypothetical protein
MLSCRQLVAEGVGVSPLTRLIPRNEEFIS